jgi:hypothetical protein
MTGAVMTPTGMPAAARRSMVRTRRSGVATQGSMARAFSRSQNGMETITPTRDVRCSAISTSMSRSMSGALVITETGLRYSAQTSRQPRVNR